MMRLDAAESLANAVIGLAVSALFFALSWVRAFALRRLFRRAEHG